MAHGFLPVFGVAGVAVSPGILGRVRDDGLGVSVWFVSAGASVFHLSGLAGVLSSQSVKWSGCSAGMKIGANGPCAVSSARVVNDVGTVP